MTPLRRCAPWLLLAACAIHAAPLWSHVDSNLVTAVDPSGPIAQVSYDGYDSTWMQVLHPDGSEDWSRSFRVKSHDPRHTLRIQALTPVPGGGWFLALDSSYTNLTGAVGMRLDAQGNSVGTPFGIRYDTCLGLSTVVTRSHTWLAPLVSSGRETTIYRFDSLGVFLDSLALPGQLGFTSLLPFGEGVVGVFQTIVDTMRVSMFLRVGAVGKSIGGLGTDTIIHPGYFPKALSVGNGSEERLVFLSDTGRLALPGTRRPRVRVTAWSPALDGLTKTCDATIDMLLPQDAWTLPASGLRVVGSREIVSSTSLFRSEVGFVDLEDDGSVRRSRVLATGAVPYSGIVPVLAIPGPGDGSGFVGRSSYSGPDTIIALDAEGDSLRTLSLPTLYEQNRWTLQANGNLVGRGTSSSGGSYSLESWDVSTPQAGVRPRLRIGSELRIIRGRVVLELASAVRSARLRVIDAHGAILEERFLGGLEPGHQELSAAGEGVRWVQMDLDGRQITTLVVDP